VEAFILYPDRTMDLFDTSPEQGPRAPSPLAYRLRPRRLEDFAGQEHFIGPGKLLRRMLLADRITSLIFYGPPGTGKTTLAVIISHHTHSEFYHLNAALAGVAQIRKILDHADRLNRSEGRRTVLFIDEIHRFNRAQQDVLLNDVERGTIVLIGATTENPFFAINSPLISRSQIFEFKPLSPDHIKAILKRALADKDQGLGNMDIEMPPEALDHLAEMCDGDARRALNALEVGALSNAPDKSGKIRYDLEVARDSIQRKALVYQGTGDEHYDAASAFIKSMRGSDPDAALYWMARMLASGEDPRFIARRIVICAAEDVGNADPQALILANAALQISEFVGLPEAQLVLAQAVTYIATAPKSNASTLAIGEAVADVREGRTLEVPDHLKDASYHGAKKLGRGQGYKYSHKFKDHWVDQEYLPEDRIYYKPTEQGYEKIIKERLEKWRKQKRARKQNDA